MATLQMPPLLVDEETGQPVEPEPGKPVDQNGTLRTPAPVTVPANPL